MLQIVPAQAGEPLEYVFSLAQEYVTWMTAEIREHYPELDIHEFISEHAYADVRKKFPGEHVPPDGCLLVALNDRQACGCIALAKLADGIGEIRTLYVRPAFRGLGAGKQLANAVLKEARKAGYRAVRLDTLGFMDSAFNLYRSLGFDVIPPYLDLSDNLKQYIRFLELKLTG